MPQNLDSGTLRIAIITGASSGMGREYTRQADRSGEYDQIWVIARRIDRLQDLAAECRTEVLPIELDLSEKDASSELAKMLEKSAQAASDCGIAFSVRLLVNAAGFAKFGTYADMTTAEVASMIDVNCRAVVEITQTVLPYCSEGSRILEVASSAAFQPLPELNVYAASKSFVLSYTRALRFELRGKGIHVTAVCPLWVKTEFIDVARQTQNGHTVNHPFPVLKPEHVVSWSTMINQINYPVATCCVTGAAMRFFSKIIPAPITMWAWELFRRI